MWKNIGDTSPIIIIGFGSQSVLFISTHANRKKENLSGGIVEEFGCQ
jgi:hypothetical protein